MAVHDHGFRVYTGERTPGWRRPLVIARDALASALGVRKTLVLLVAAGLSALVFAVLIYLHHNIEALLLFRIPMEELLPIDRGFFLAFLRLHGIFAALLVLVAGPNLIAADLRDNALPLYLGRPLSRLEYVLGKLSVLAILGSAVTWVPGLALVGLQAALAGPSWLWQNLPIAAGIFFGSWLIILVLALVCLALSALLRAKVAIEIAFLAFFLMLSMLGAMLQALLRASWVAYLDVPGLVGTVTRAILGHPIDGPLAPVPAAIALALLLLACVAVLARRVRAYEVVR
jgi:ABC-2 type transport system permease protein